MPDEPTFATSTGLGPLARRATRRSARVLVVVGAALGALVGGAREAHAQPSSRSTVAEALFREGAALMKAGKTHEACAKFEASQHVEAALGTLLNLASCREKEGKTATAWTQFAEVASLAQRAGDTAREDYARERIASLEKELHRVMIEMPARPEGLEMKLDGHPFDRAAIGTAIPLDPGEHTFEVRAPGKKTWSRKINLGPSAGLDRLEVPPLEDADQVAAPEAPPPAARAPVVAPQPPPPTAPSPPARPSDGSSTARTLGYVAGGVGVAGLGVATFFGLTTLNHASKARTICTEGVPCFDQGAFHEHHLAEVSQQWMIVSGVVGLAALGVGAYLVLSSGESDEASAGRVGKLDVRPSVGPRGGQLSLTGTW